MNRHVSAASVPAAPHAQDRYSAAFGLEEAGLPLTPQAASQQAGLAAVISIAQSAAVTGPLPAVLAAPAGLAPPAALAPPAVLPPPTRLPAPVRFPPPRSPAYHEQLTSPAYHEQLTRPAYHEQLTRPAYHEQLTRPAYHEQLTRPAALGRPAAPQPSQQAGNGRHAAAASGTIDRHASRFVLFAAIGGVIFLAGLGLQAGLTGQLHMLPFVSYLIQAVLSVETSFLLNRWLTWRDRDTEFWVAFGRFNLQKTVTVAANLALYYGLLRLGMNYLVANVVLTVVFTVVNYVAGDRLVFTPYKTRPAEPDSPPAQTRVRLPRVPGVSVVIPCRDNEATIGEAVLSLLDQDYPGLTEIILIGSPGDRTWQALAGITDPRLTTMEIQTPPGVRDANYKRDAGIGKTSGDLIALVDSDIVLPSDWMSRAIFALQSSGASCVAGGMRSIHDSFWGRYTDTTVIGAKTPRIPASYTVTSQNFGARGRKPPITANTLFTRELYDRCPIDPSWSHGSYEDYEWFWRVTRAGYGVRVCQDIFGWHHHRRGLRPLFKEYLRSSRGCAYFVRAHRDSPLARRRLREAIILPITAVIVALAAGAAAVDGYGRAVATLMLGGLVMLSMLQVARSRRLESVAYPVVGLALGLVFTMGLDTHLIRSGSAAAGNAGAGNAGAGYAGTGYAEPGYAGPGYAEPGYAEPGYAEPGYVQPGYAGPGYAEPGHAADYRLDPSAGPQAPARQLPQRPTRRILHPLTAICAVQAALSLTLVWSNTAFSDEAQYLWAGHVELAHWLHGGLVPSYLSRLSGSPLVYPPLGALADSIGGLAAARILSLVFMLVATVLLYCTASRLIGRTGAVFATALWALSEPAIRLAFATYDPLSVLLTALAAWLAVQAGYRRRRGELVAAAAVALALANMTAYSGIVIDPVVIAFAFFVWLPRMGRQQAAFCTAWFAGALVLCFSLLMTLTHSWAGTAAVFSRSSPDHQSLLLVLNDIWQFSGLIMGLALIGAIAAGSSEGSMRTALLVLLASAGFLVPVAQLHDQTAWALDKHLAYGIWFAVIAAGYACGRLIQWFPGTGRRLAAACCVIALAYPAVSGWESAWQTYHAWPDAGSFVTAIKPAVASSQGLIFVPGQQNIAEYYTPQGLDWQRWSDAISFFPPASLPRKTWVTYYRDQLNGGNFGVVTLFYSTTFRAVSMPAGILLPHHSDQVYQELLGLVGQNSAEPGLPALTQALETDPAYRLVSTGPFDTSNLSGTHDYSIYAIWQKKAPE